MGPARDESARLRPGLVRVVTIVGARPQFIKAAAVSRAIAEHNRMHRLIAGATQRVAGPMPEAGGAAIEERLVHTGQHYDDNMSAVFFEELGVPSPAHHLGVGSGSHGRQTAAMLAKLGPILQGERPDVVLLYGDTNSTLAGALAAAGAGVPVAHVEAGLRSFNRRMAEEINRVLTDRLSARLYCPTRRAVGNLAAEGIEDGVRLVGDVMFDSVRHHAGGAPARRARLGVAGEAYVLATIHRAENTDDPARLGAIVAGLSRVRGLVVWPVHPRTRARLEAMGSAMGRNVRAIAPAPYLDMLALESGAWAIVTDSGGVQKEAYFSRVPCVTVREETEWVELVEHGWNRLTRADADDIAAGLAWAEAFRPPATPDGLYGDGRAAERIVGDLAEMAA